MDDMKFVTSFFLAYTKAILEIDRRLTFLSFYSVFFTCNFALLGFFILHDFLLIFSFEESS